MLLGRTANGLFWMARYLERAESMARLLDAGQHLTLTRGTRPADWHSVLAAAGVEAGFAEIGGPTEGKAVIDFMLRDPSNPSSVRGAFESARANARSVRTALTRDSWEAINQSWREIDGLLTWPVSATDLPATLATVKRTSALIRGMLVNTMLRNDIFEFIQLGLMVERADMTARTLDVKYHVLLPSASWVGSPLDITQWESILRSVSAHKSFHWIYGPETTPADIIDYLMLNARMPRSLAFCYGALNDALRQLAREYGSAPPSHTHARAIASGLAGTDVAQIVDEGLHEVLQRFLRDNAALGEQIAADYNFIGDTACA